MRELIKLLNEFEDRNNISVFISLHSDGSNELVEFWEEEILTTKNTVTGLKNYLKTTYYKKADDGRCLSPVEVIYTYRSKTLEEETMEFIKSLPDVKKEMLNSRYKHKNGAEYTVIMLTNTDTTPDRLEDHPVDVVYVGDNGKQWSRRLSDWDRSFTKIKP